MSEQTINQPKPGTRQQQITLPLNDPNTKTLNVKVHNDLIRVMHKTEMEPNGEGNRTLAIREGEFDSKVHWRLDEEGKPIKKPKRAKLDDDGEKVGE